MTHPVKIDADEEMLDYSQGQLRAYAEHQAAPGFDKIEDPKVFLDTLKTISQVAIARKRVRVEEQVADTNEAAAADIAALLREKAIREIYQVTTPVERAVPRLGEEHQATLQNPGVKDINPPPIDIKSFMVETAHLVEE